ncbi:Predicted membrane protein [Serratia rubidaea]|uniref:Predicted membrane protein n=2 Tax=Serratia rubidaea TaxID=61652 RepID=A0A4U9HML8_SERRU|nr:MULTISPECIES: multidrug/biocide efflux PACE transporter [Serratia]AGB83421.1 putative membrane protein [Serratia sp. FGI94]MBS0976037.1 multidrug/biocide efflux PACE transporter [Serratia rubidaea]MCR1000267.1 multidrug/biocide efflux PACE transporter [Serratia rubidaea]MDC6109904.1 multidrug/biocide efflux PACE transporter [Serratia rubidaea]MDK1702186.1 multidrug/biocide efflux PACE transporter [Serratia rubidaea]
MQLQNKSFSERIVHAVGFEAIAVMICAPLGAWILGRSMTQVGALAVMLSSVAMLWNIIYNAGFDRLWPVSRVTRNLTVRILHAAGFETGFILIGVPIAAFMLNLTLVQAFMLELGFFLFFLPYTVVYNWAYDALRQRWLASRLAVK